MRTRVTFAFFIVSFCVNAALVEITVVDNHGEPVEDAKSEVAFATYRKNGEKIVRGLTTKDGKFKARGSSNHSTFVTVEKDGHYRSRIEKLKANTDYDLTVVLPRIRNPRPLVTNVSTVLQEFPELPLFDTWIGFDLEKADWVAPHGKGSVVDFNIYTSKEFLGFAVTERRMVAIRERYTEFSEDEFRLYWGIWEVSLRLTFPESRSGIFESPEYFGYSEMPMPHQAPNTVYRSEWGWDHNRIMISDGRNAGKGYLMKTRVEIDDEGDEISANYSKFLGIPWFDIGGTIRWEYYFNPDPNDRNLEYDGTNLAETQK